MAGKAGQEILAQLVRQADVLIDNFKLGTLAKWGFDDAWFERARAAPRALLDHRLRSDRPESGAAGLRLHPAGGIRPDEHLRRRRTASRPNTVSRSSTCAPACSRATRSWPRINARHPPAAARRSTCRFTSHRCSMLVNVGSNYLDRRPRRRTLRQWPSEHRAVHDLSGRRRDDRGRGRQRHAVRASSPPRSGIRNGRRTRASRRTATASPTATSVDGMIARGIIRRHSGRLAGQAEGGRRSLRPHQFGRAGARRPAHRGAADGRDGRASA